MARRGCPLLRQSPEDIGCGRSGNCCAALSGAAPRLPAQLRLEHLNRQRERALRLALQYAHVYDMSGDFRAPFIAHADEHRIFPRIFMRRVMDCPFHVKRRVAHLGTFGFVLPRFKPQVFSACRTQAGTL